MTIPPQKKASDSGITNKKTEEFIVEGKKIYDLNDIKEFAPNFKVVRAEVIEHTRIESHQMEGITVEAKANA